MLNICGKIGAIVAFILLLTACGEKKKEIKGNLEPMMYSRLLSSGTVQGENVVEIRSVVGADTLVRRFVLRDSAAFAAGKALPMELEGATVLRVPLKRVVALSSAQIGYMLKLGVADRIIAVGEGKYIADSALYYRVESNRRVGNGDSSAVIQSEAKNPVTDIVAEIGYGNAMDYEKLMALKPDLVMTFATGGSEDDYNRMERLGIPVMLTSEWQDESPLAKAEWIKLYAMLFDDGSKKLKNPAYLAFASEAALYENKNSVLWDEKWNRDSCDGPKVIAGMSYGGVWYAPGANSYTGRLIGESGGCYLWKDSLSRELKLTLEDVMLVAEQADVWLNPGMFSTPEEILAAEPRAANIKAFREKRVYQNDKRKGPGGGNDFYESGVARPNEMLLNVEGSIFKGNPPDSLSIWYHNIF